MSDWLMGRMLQLVQAELESQGISQAAFCRRVGVSSKHLNRCLNGHAQPAIATIEYWAWCLGCAFEVRLVARDAAPPTTSGNLQNEAADL